jgi:hypothetical protein
VSVPLGRQCQNALNSIHSTIYFSLDFEKALVGHGITDPMAAYLAGRSAALGAVGPGPVTAAFYGFSPAMIARHLPAVWRLAAPETVLAARWRAADAILRRHLGDTVASAEMAEAAELAMRATQACVRAGRSLYAAHADLEAPDQPHLRLWYAATLLREHRGDAHNTVLAQAELYGLDAVVMDCASPFGMPKDMIMAKRGWTDQEWSVAEGRLRDRGLMNEGGRLTEAGLKLRSDVELDTDRLDRAPYEHLGAAAAIRLTEEVNKLVMLAGSTGAFPAQLVALFAPPAN